MPSLIGTTVATNYLKLPAQNTYGDGSLYSNFGTRSLVAIKINKSTAGSSSDLTKGSDGATGAFTDTNSLLSRVIRTVQAYAEIYYVGAPDASNVIMLISGDTMNSAAVSGHTQVTTSGFASLAADIATAVNSSGASGTAFTITQSGSTTAAQIFVGAAVGTFA
jgi:hypothetical protein